MASPPAAPRPLDPPPRIGVSSCLLGQAVRWDGGHKKNAFLLGSFAPFVEWVPVCPEVEIGLGTPRETIRLERRAGETRLVSKSGIDHTEKMRRFAERRVRSLAGQDLCGYVLKKDSPSCGMERVKLYEGAGPASRTGVGLYAQALKEQFPHLPVEEEGRLGDARLRDNFVERVFAYRRVRTFFAGRWTLGGLVAFHGAHKLQVMAHSTVAYQSLGRLVAGAKGRERGALRTAYEEGLMTALTTPATARRHVNVLQHMAGYFKKTLPSGDRAELAGVIEEYGRGLLPLIVPITLVRHHVRRLEVTYLAGQTYLDPHPRELMLRNHV